MRPERNDHLIGGFANLKRWLDRAQVAVGPEARELKLPPPRGVLLVGVRGCGKTLAAQAIARLWDLPLVSLDGRRLAAEPDAEERLQQVFAAAEQAAPAVLGIDEIEQAMAPAGTDSDRPLARRLLSAFITWSESKPADVFVVATANDLYRLPPELLRKGRFDETFFVDLPDPEERAEILRVHLRRTAGGFEGIDVQQAVDETRGFTGAQIAEAVSAAASRRDSRGALDTEALLAAIADLVPFGLTHRAELTRLRELARERFVPVR